MTLRTLYTCGLMALALSLHAFAAAAETDAWNQRRVTDLAIHLARTTQTIRTDLRHSPTPLRADDDLVQLQRASEQLASELEDGGDRSATRAEYARVVMLCREGTTHVSEPRIPHAARTGLVLAGDLIAQLGVYYDAPSPVPASISRR